MFSSCAVSKVTASAASWRLELLRTGRTNRRIRRPCRTTILRINIRHMLRLFASMLAAFASWDTMTRFRDGRMTHQEIAKFPSFVEIWVNTHQPLACVAHSGNGCQSAPVRPTWCYKNVKANTPSYICVFNGFS